MTEQSEPLVRLDNICLGFKDIRILDNISFEILSGQIVTLIGPNGAGKTTLLKVILGIIRPDSGKIWKKSNIKIGYVPQKLNLSRTIPLTVKRFLCLDFRYEDKELADVLKQTGLQPDILQKSVHPLSGGEIQRVLLARTLLKAPDLLVLDEPAQGLDPVGEEQFYALLDKLNQTKKYAIVMVSHDLHIVMAGSHRVLCINHHICCSGTPDEISDLPGYRHLYGDKPALAVYRHRHNHLHLPNGEIQHVD